PNQQLICLMTEYPIWRDRDRHQIAYQVLLERRGREIANRLKINLSAPDNACVRCHGIAMPAGIEPTQFVPERDGGTCVACHGALREWTLDTKRQNTRRWRALTRAKKETQRGMRDRWTPRPRVEICLSCHVGAPAQKKVLTHDMYVAGPPPLPSFEVAI